MCLWISYKKKIWKKLIFFASLMSLKKEFGSGVESGSISQMYRSTDPDPHQYVADPQHFPVHCTIGIIWLILWLVFRGSLQSANSPYGVKKISTKWLWPVEVMLEVSNSNMWFKISSGRRISNFQRALQHFSEGYRLSLETLKFKLYYGQNWTKTFGRRVESRLIRSVQIKWRLGYFFYFILNGFHHRIGKNN